MPVFAGKKIFFIFIFYSVFLYQVAANVIGTAPNEVQVHARLLKQSVIHVISMNIG